MALSRRYNIEPMDPSEAPAWVLAVNIRQNIDAAMLTVLIYDMSAYGIGLWGF